MILLELGKSYQLSMLWFKRVKLGIPPAPSQLDGVVLYLLPSLNFDLD
jgi:hypothetical protein